MIWWKEWRENQGKSLRWLLFILGIGLWSLMTYPREMMPEEVFSPSQIFIGVLFAVSLASGLISKEVHEGTLQFLLTKPIKRHRIFSVKFLTGALQLSLVMIIATLALYLVALYQHREITFTKTLEKIATSILIPLTYYSITFLFSIFIDNANRNRIAGFLLGSIFLYNVYLVFSLLSTLERSIVFMSVISIVFITSLLAFEDKEAIGRS